MLGNDARRGRVGDSGGVRAGLGGFPFSTTLTKGGVCMANGECEPSALERRTSWVGAEIERWGVAGTGGRDTPDP